MDTDVKRQMSSREKPKRERRMDTKNRRTKAVTNVLAKRIARGVNHSEKTACRSFLLASCDWIGHPVIYRTLDISSTAETWDRLRL